MKTALRILAWLVGVLVVAAIAAYAWAHIVSERHITATHPFKPMPIAVPTDAASVEEGTRLATVRACNGCHGKRGEGTVIFDDAKIARIVAPNLTVAARKYDDAQLAAIIRSGVRPDGRSLAVMPSQVYAHLTDEDLGRIIAFVRSLPTTEGLAPGFDVGPLGRVGLAAGKFKMITEEISTGKAPTAAPEGSVQARGRYLARTICAECHGTDMLGKTTPAYVATDLRIVGAYTPEAFTQLLRTGVALGGRPLPFMGPIARSHLAKLNDDEIAALYAYLKGFGATPAS